PCHNAIRQANQGDDYTALMADAREVERGADMCYRLDNASAQAAARAVMNTYTAKMSDLCKNNSNTMDPTEIAKNMFNVNCSDPANAANPICQNQCNRANAMDDPICRQILGLPPKGTTPDPTYGQNSLGTTGLENTLGLNEYE